MLFLSIFLNHNDPSFPYKGGTQFSSDLPFIDIRPPLPGTIYYNHFNCSDDAKSLEECNGQFAEEHCYTRGLDFIIQCNLGKFVIYMHIVNKILIKPLTLWM